MNDSPLTDSLVRTGRFCLEKWEGRRLLGRVWYPNGIISASIDDLNNKYFRNGTPPSAWYMGLIDNTGFSALSSSDSMSSHAGWTEITSYSESTRPQWSPGASASGVLVNATRVEFTATADISVRGSFIVSNSTKGGTTGTLWSTGVRSSAIEYKTGQIVKAFYQLTSRAG